MKLLPEEALNAATINGAFAMGLGNSLGSITRGKLANLIITKPVPSLAYLPYRFGSNLIDKVILRGQFHRLSFVYWALYPTSMPNILSRKKKSADFIESVTRRSTVFISGIKKGDWNFYFIFFSHPAIQG